MTIPERISSDIVAAMKEKQAERLAALRMIKTALKNQEIEAGAPLDDAAAVPVLMRMAKQRRESIEQFEKGGRDDLVAKEKSELAVIDEYLPNAPDEAEVRAAVQAAIARTGATSPKQMGAVIKEVMAAFQGRPVDGKAVSQMAKEALG